MPKATERRSKSIVRSHASGSISWIFSRAPPAPALLNTTSIAPVSLLARSIRALIDSVEQTSQR